MRKLCTIVVGSCLALTGLAIPLAARTGPDDPDLTRRVIEVMEDHHLSGMFDDVEIAVESRVVTLSGQVTRPAKKEDIARRVAQIDGVRRVVNEIRVLPVSPTDDDLRLRVARAIYNHPSFWHYASMSHPPVHIIVKHGQVTLKGQVRTELDRSLAYALAQVPGAHSVTNDLNLE